MTKLVHKDRQTIKGPKDIIEHTQNYDVKLYKQDTMHCLHAINNAEQHFVKNNNIPMISDTDK